MECIIKGRVYGVTGGICSGKSVFTDMVKARGYTVIDADEVSRNLTKKGGEIYRAMCEIFPTAVSGELDRAKVREIIAADEGARIRLNKLTHPAIREEIERKLKECADKTVFLCVPLFFECGYDTLCDEVIAISCPASVRVKRLRERDAMSIAAAEKLVAAQMNDEKRDSLCDYVLSSDCSFDTFTARCNEFLDKLLPSE